MFIFSPRGIFVSSLWLLFFVVIAYFLRCSFFYFHMAYFPLSIACFLCLPFISFFFLHDFLEINATVRASFPLLSGPFLFSLFHRVRLRKRHREGAIEAGRSFSRPRRAFKWVGQRIVKYLYLPPIRYQPLNCTPPLRHHRATGTGEKVAATILVKKNM